MSHHMSIMSRPFIITPLLFILMAFSAAEESSELALAPSSVISDDFSNAPETHFLMAASVIREARQIYSSTTITYILTTTISSVTSTTITTKKTCAILASGVTINGITTLTTTPATTCRRRRLYWDQPVFVAFQGDDNLAMQFHEINPSQLLRLEPTMLTPEFRNNNNNYKVHQNNNRKKAPPTVIRVQQQQQQQEEEIDTDSSSPSIIQPSIEQFEPFEQSFGNTRIAQPIYFTALSSIISTILSNLLLSTSKITSTSTVYTSTYTSTTYTATSSYYVAGACYPSGLSTC